MQPIVALGCGLVGEYVIHRLADDGHPVTAVDIRIPQSLRNRQEIFSIEQDAKRYVESLQESTIIINMLPGRIGHAIRETLVKGGHQIVDLAFTEEDPQTLDELAKQFGATMVWDIGIAPGLSNMLLAKAQRELGTLDNVSIHVGGNPTEPDEHWSYMAPFSPSDVIEEYTRPARVVRDGEIVTLPALAERHNIEVEGTDGMDAFLTDGLRSVLTTIDATNMAEYTVRWPQHVDRWLAEGDSTPENELLTAWKFDANRPEFTWMKVRCQAQESIKEWTVVDYGKDGNGSMARTTGLVTYALASLFATKGPEYCGLQNGIYSPELLNESTLKFILDVFKEHGVSVS
ncbi:MAG: saccharopine dehydrogenase family protein [Candidatus Poseidoniaceae archaeon]